MAESISKLVLSIGIGVFLGVFHVLLGHAREMVKFSCMCTMYSLWLLILNVPGSNPFTVPALIIFISVAYGGKGYASKDKEKGYVRRISHEKSDDSGDGESKGGEEPFS